MQFLSDVNFNKNDLQNAKIENLSTAPSNPVLGQVYFNTISNNLFCWNGTQWVNVTQGLSTKATSLTCTLPDNL